VDTIVKGLSLNERALALADDCEAAAELLRAAVHVLPGGARVIDVGVDVQGGVGAGLAMARICMGGLGHVQLTTITLDGESLDGVHVWTDHPAVACMASQYAGWAITPEGYFAMGSGPLRAKARVERELFDKLQYAENDDHGVLVLEGRTMPTQSVADWIARKAGISSANLTLMIAPTASQAGGVQVVARVVETGLHKMDTLGFDVKKVVSASGTAPLPPVARSDIRAIGRTNDCVLYGGQARYLIDAADDELAAMAPRLPASASSDYGTPFYEIFNSYNRDFYQIDPLLFSPAEVWLTSATSGRTFHAGHVNVEVLRTSLFEGL
jgi:methenyltetrahydromethanopterin cyclohydrolase